MVNEISEQQSPKKKSSKIIIALMIPVVLFFALMIYGAYGFSQLGRTEWKDFDAQRVAYLEEHFKMDIPDEDTLEMFKRISAPGDGENGWYLLWLEGVSAPEDFMEKAYADAGYRIVESSDKDYANALEKVQYKGGRSKDKFDENDLIYKIEITNEGKPRKSEHYVAFKESRNGYDVKVTMILLGD